MKRGFFWCGYLETPDGVSVLIVVLLDAQVVIRMRNEATYGYLKLYIEDHNHVNPIRTKEQVARHIFKPGLTYAVGKIHTGRLRYLPSQQRYPDEARGGRTNALDPVTKFVASAIISGKLVTEAVCDRGMTEEPWFVHNTAGIEHGNITSKCWNLVYLSIVKLVEETEPARGFAYRTEPLRLSFEWCHSYGFMGRMRSGRLGYERACLTQVIVEEVPVRSSHQETYIEH